MTEMGPGSAFPLGATPASGGTGFAVASEVADTVVLCLFDSHGRETQLPLPEYDAGVWHGFVPDVGPGGGTATGCTAPWDVGQPDSYDVGRFPPEWSEWNSKYRDKVPDFWRSQDGQLGQVATRVTGSPDLYGWSRRRPAATINLITSRDGFTLRDLVSYDTRHNQANGEANRDGTDDNRSWGTAG
jgi:pullulanase/glycogen debranching enzyme